MISKAAVSAPDVPESSSIYPFLAFYLYTATVGLTSFLASHLISTRVLYPYLLASFQPRITYIIGHDEKISMRIVRRTIPRLTAAPLRVVQLLTRQ